MFSGGICVAEIHGQSGAYIGFLIGECPAGDIIFRDYGGRLGKYGDDFQFSYCFVCHVTAYQDMVVGNHIVEIQGNVFF